MKFLSAYNAAHASVRHCCHHSCFCMVHYVSITLWWQPVVFKEKQIKFWCRFSSSCVSSFCFGHFFCWRGKHILSKSSLQELSSIYTSPYILVLIAFLSLINSKAAEKRRWEALEELTIPNRPIKIVGSCIDLSGVPFPGRFMCHYVTGYIVGVQRFAVMMHLWHICST